LRSRLNSGNAPSVYRAVFLDLDDTLYDRASAFRAWIDDLARVQLKRPLDEREFTAVKVLDERGHRPRHRFAADVRDNIGLFIDPDRAPAQITEYVEPEPGVREAVAKLAATRRVAIVTNGGMWQHTKLARIGLTEIVHAVFVSAELGFAKPELAMFEHALRWAGVQPIDALFVGDHPRADLLPAAGLGMATAWRARDEWPSAFPLPTYTIETIPQLLEICA
jgi:putative hydrolase of the HAD superfamily